MKTVCVSAVLCAAACLGLAAGEAASGVSGNYMEARTADVYTGPCFANGEVNINGREAVFGWKIERGGWNGVSLAGLGVVGVVRTPRTLGDVYSPVNPALAVLIVDSRASAAQRDALVAFARSQAPELLRDVAAVTSAPVELTVDGGDVHLAKAHLTAGSLAEIATRGMTAAEHICGNEEVYYPPLVPLEHAMPAYALKNAYRGDGLGETWSAPYRRSAFVGTFSAEAAASEATR
jgi:hypothetical protein